MPKPPAIPEHGIQSDDTGSAVDWVRFYAYLDALVVPIPEHAPGEPPDGNSLSILLIRVQNNRQKLESLSRLVDQRVATTKRALVAAVETLRLERAYAMRGATLGNSETRKAAVDRQTEMRSAQVAALKGRLADFEGARGSVNSQMKTMETCKQTLNSIRQLILGGASPDGDEFSRGNTPTRRPR